MALARVCLDSMLHPDWRLAKNLLDTLQSALESSVEECATLRGPTWLLGLCRGSMLVRARLSLQPSPAGATPPSPLLPARICVEGSSPGDLFQIVELIVNTLLAQGLPVDLAETL